MKVLVIGLGSMGKRRVRLMQALYKDFEIFGVDGKPECREEAASVLGITTYASISEAHQAEDIDCAFVCTSPLSHASIIHECLENDWHVFTEINLVADGYEENMALAKEKGKVLFLSSTNLYSNEIDFIKKTTENSDKWNYIFHVGQYLPDWHPWQSYKDFFIGDKRTNGCREILAIELPWLVKSFGDVVEYQVMKDKNTDLDIDFNDNYVIQLKHKNGNKGAFVVDVVSPVAIRYFEAYGENKYVSWQGTPESLMVFDPETKALKQATLTQNVEHVDGYAAFIIENDYTNEIESFFNYVLNGVKPVYTFEDDLAVLHLIDELEAEK